MFGKQSETWLIVGLGNPGREYDNTRHNAGFRALDILSDKLGCKVDKAKFQGLYGQVNYKGKKLLLLKPQTFMNLSGPAFERISNSHIKEVVVHNTIPVDNTLCPKIKQLDVAPIFARAIDHVHGGTSIADLF